MLHLLPRGAVGRVLAVVMLTALIGIVTSTLLYERSDHIDIREEEAHRTSEHIVIVSRMLEDESPERRVKIAESSSTEHFKLMWQSAPIVPEAAPDLLMEMQQQMVVWEPSLKGKPLRLRIGDKATEVIGSLQLSDGSHLNFRAQDLVGTWPLKWSRIALASLPTILLMLVAIVALRAMLRPLKVLAEAATRVGLGESIVLEEQGLPEFQRLIRAYNDMQGRIAEMMKSRTEALAAVGHDLRTPLARMRLNVDNVDDDATRDGLIDDLDEMEQMLDSLLTYFRGDANPEKPRLVDIAVLLGTIVNSLRDQGYDITYTGPEHCDAWLRPVDFKRALSNLCNNACQYAEHGYASLHISAKTISVVIEDDGPGIPEEYMQAILEPFMRLDPARQRNTSGVGLGIPITARVVATVGGKLIFSNRPQGGLRAQIDLPKHPHSNTL